MKKKETKENKENEAYLKEEVKKIDVKEERVETQSDLAPIPMESVIHGG